ncbi:hypothetical protein NBO_1282g0001 [Nosema bombycis CQ1]|uniref:Uncharacterized protein n=1 Tax=Nosema bombycis (strain CQ1 / CVCC 102059) TaxID=578461 RepID=R0KL32_NOSB1|nr:hypothetical protein NBO_1282g0001 [Nosema bombycis CQ1]|eukprot:EOB11331.1 hypothetical protein NBO_1282g0001 [Nosema bombycis CQ1]
MNWITILLSYFLGIQGSCASIEKIYFLENNFWEEDQGYVETEKGFFCAIYEDYLKEPNCNFQFLTLPENCIYFKSLNYAYTFLCKADNDFINSCIQSGDLKNVFLNIVLYFYDQPLETEEEFDNYTGRKRLVPTYKPLEKVLGNDESISEVEKIQMRLLHIKPRLSIFLLKETVVIKDIADTEIEIRLNELLLFEMFKFYYFEEYTDCLKCAKDFLDTLCYFELVDDDNDKTSDQELPGCSINSKNKMKASEFVKRLLEKFDDVTAHSNKTCFDKPAEIEVRKYTDSLINKCVLYIKNQLLNKELMLLIGDKYNIDFYIEKFHSIISTAVKKVSDVKRLRPEEEDKFFEEEFEMENNEIEKLKMAALNHLCETDFIPNYFSKVLGKKIETLEDYIAIDKMACDFHNIICKIINIIAVKENPQFDLKPYYEPVNDDCNYKLVEGFMIKLEKGVKLKQIKGFNDKGGTIKLESEEHYVIDQSNSYNFVKKVLEIKNIREIELLLKDNGRGFVVYRINIEKFEADERIIYQFN